MPTGPIKYPDEQDLLAAIRLGDPSAFETVFKRYYALCCDVSASVVDCYDTAEELSSTLFGKIWERREGWDPVEGIAPYLIRGIRNLSLNYIRDTGLRARKHQEYSGITDIPWMGDSPNAPDKASEDQDVRTRIWSTVATLPKATQVVLAMRWRHGLTWDEVAAATGSSPAAVQMQFHRARLVLQKKLEGLVS